MEMWRHGPVEKKWILCLILASIVLPQVRSQITAPDADRADSVQYPVTAGKDPLFIFYQTNQVYRPGSLTATLPGGPWNFEWRRYDPSTGGYGPAFHTDAGTLSSTVSELEEGGYRVRVWDGVATDITMRAWVMLDRLTAGTEKSAEGKLPIYKRTCDFVVVTGFVTPDTLTYYDPGSGDAVRRIMDFSFRWTSDNPDLRIPNDTIVLDPNITYQPPYEDTWYILTATDELGMVDVDSVFYESIQTRAQFSVEYLDKVNQDDPDLKWNPNLTGSWSADEGSLDAMLTVRFTNESKNGATFEWVYLDTLGGPRLSETTYVVDEIVEFTYDNADRYYYPYMISTSEELCSDTFRLEQAIYVVPSQLVIPNVFTPNGDGVNDYFVFKHQSLRYCKVTIVDRTGKVVYRREIDDIYTWDGWDGNLHESNRRAPEGQYYFVVEATGYDGAEYKDPTIFENWRLNLGNRTGGTSGSTSGGTDPAEEAGNLYTGWLYLYRNTGDY